MAAYEAFFEEKKRNISMEEFFAVREDVGRKRKMAPKAEDLV